VCYLVFVVLTSKGFHESKPVEEMEWALFILPSVLGFVYNVKDPPVHSSTVHIIAHEQVEEIDLDSCMP
jgi:hypothetical protein